MNNWISISVAFVGVIFAFIVRSRNNHIDRLSEDRLRADTYLRAVQLMTSDDVDVEERQFRIEGIIISLVEMKNLRLAFQLSDSYFNNGKISVRLFLYILNSCLLFGDKSLKSDAIALLARLNEKVSAELTDKIIFLDAVFVDWIHQDQLVEDLTPDNKHSLRDSLIDLLMSKPISEWKGHVPNQVFHTLYMIVRTDPDPTQKISAALFMAPLLLKLKMTSEGYVGPNKENVKFFEVGKEIEERYPQLDDFEWLTSQKAMLQDTYDKCQELKLWLVDD